jgi:hypothetical protein
MSGMPIHMIKLCVGADSIEDLRGWQRQRLAVFKARGEELLLKHTTRQMPKRRADILDGGSLYWVIKGVISCRQRIVDLRAIVDGDGVERCDICLDPETVPVDPRPRGPFQGWRYFEPKDAPPDLGAAGMGAADMPMDLRLELQRLGVM